MKNKLFSVLSLTFVSVVGISASISFTRTGDVKQAQALEEVPVMNRVFDGEQELDSSVGLRTSIIGATTTDYSASFDIKFSTGFIFLKKCNLKCNHDNWLFELSYF